MGLTGGGSGAFAQEAEFTSGNTGTVPVSSPAAVSFSNAQIGSGVSITCNAPATITAGNLLVAVYSVGIGSATTWTLPSGWTQVAQSSGSTDNFGTVLAVKAATGSEPASYTFSQTHGALQSVIIGQYRNASSVDASAFANTAGASTTVTAPSVTPTKGGEMLVAVYSAGASNSFTTPTSPSGLVREQTVNGSTGLTMVWFDNVYPTTAATGSITSTLGASSLAMGLSLFLT